MDFKETGFEKMCWIQLAKEQGAFSGCYDHGKDL